jgi:hypothetical protein
MAAKSFKPCADCPNAAACKKAGKCMAKEKKMAKGGMSKKGGPDLVIMLGVAPKKKMKK